MVNTLRPRQDGRRFTNDIFKRIFFNEKILISIEISLEFVPKSSTNNKLALVHIMTWRWTNGGPVWWRIHVSLGLNELRWLAELALTLWHVNSCIHVKWWDAINSLAPGKFQWNFRQAIFKQILVFDGSGIYCEIAIIWLSLGFNDNQSTLVQAMAWCRQATSHYLSQCWPRYMSPNGVTRPQWVNCPNPDSYFRFTKLSWINKENIVYLHNHISR